MYWLTDYAHYGLFGNALCKAGLVDFNVVIICRDNGDVVVNDGEDFLSFSSMYQTYMAFVDKDRILFPKFAISYLDDIEVDYDFTVIVNAVAGDLDVIASKAISIISSQTSEGRSTVYRSSTMTIRRDGSITTYPSNS